MPLTNFEELDKASQEPIPTKDPGDNYIQETTIPALDIGAKIAEGQMDSQPIESMRMGNNEISLETMKAQEAKRAELEIKPAMGTPGQPLDMKDLLKKSHSDQAPTN